MASILALAIATLQDEEDQRRMNKKQAQKERSKRKAQEQISKDQEQINKTQKQVQRQRNIEKVQEQTNMEQVQGQTCLLQSVQIKRSNSFNLPDDEFIKMYRLSKPVALRVIELLQPFLEARTLNRNCFSVDAKVLCALRFFATGYEQRLVSDDSNTKMSQQSASKFIRLVSEGLNRLLKICVKFPRDRGIQETMKDEFYEYCGLSGVLGAIGCTHVALQSPKDDDYHPKKSYMNSKNFYSLKVQLVCNAKQKILNVAASFPGSTGDAYIWSSGSLRRSFAQGRVIKENSWLIGDSGYPSEPWLKTPILLATTDEEFSFNSAHSRGMSIIKTVNGTLKSRFQCLQKKRMLRYDPVTACKIINACVVLHNICVKNKLAWTHEPLDEEDEPFCTAAAQDRVITEFLSLL